MTSPSAPDPVERLISAYENMLERVHAAWDRAEKGSLLSLRRNLSQAREKAVELGELTREEAEKVSGYLERDVKDAAGFLSTNERAFAEWLRFDLQLIEGRLEEMFANVADRTRLELQALARQADEASAYHTGEVTGPGTLICAACGKELHFHRTGHIPPCPQCRSTRYRRPEAPG